MYDDKQHMLTLRPICNVKTTLSVGCPTGVTIDQSTGTFEADDVLTCSANGHNPTYTWTGVAGVNGDTVSATGDTYALLEGPFYVICTATVSQLSCRDSATVTGIAYGEYCKEHNTCTLYRSTGRPMACQGLSVTVFFPLASVQEQC